MSQSSPAIANRYDFVYLFDVADGNPNGDPDAGNQPRIDPETERLVTDVCVKRKIRNVVPLLAEGPDSHEIYFQTQDATNNLRILNLQHQCAIDAVKVDMPAPAETPKVEQPAEEKKPKKKTDKGGDKSADVTALARQWMCQRFWDVRAFGAVMTTGVNCGQVRGPVQLTFARSIGPILSLEHAITGKSVTTEEDAAAQIKKDGSITGTMGRKMTLPTASTAVTDSCRRNWPRRPASPRPTCALWKRWYGCSSKTARRRAARWRRGCTSSSTPAPWATPRPTGCKQW